VIHSIGWKELCRRVWQQTSEDDLFTWAASLAYSWVFAIFPFLIFLLTLVPLMPARSRTHAGYQIKAALKYLPESAGKPLSDQVDVVLNTTHGGLLSIGLIVSLWAASGGMSMTMTALDRCYDIKDGRTYLRQRFLALLITMVGTVLIILVMILLPVARFVISWLAWQGEMGPMLWAVNILRFVVAILLLQAILALVYHFGPSVARRFVFVTPGSVFSILVWLLLIVTFNRYINSFGAKSYSATYGTVAGVAILLLFFYIDAIVLLIGAEIDSEIDFAMLGLPSTAADDPGRAPLRPPSSAETELITLLRKKRHIADASPPALKETSPPTSSTVERSLPPALRRGLAASAIAAFCGIAAWSVARAARTSQRTAVERERLARAYPTVYEVIK
jgi:membrane protein